MSPPAITRSRRSAALGFVLVTMLLDIMGIGVIVPVLPSLVGEFTVSREMQSYWYGGLLASFGLMNFLASPLLGALSDRFGRRPVLLLSTFGLGTDFVLQALSPTLGWLLVARLIGGVTSASFTISSAYVADVTPPEGRSRGFGMLGAMFGVGFIVGPMVGGLLGAHDVRLPFYVSGALCLINCAYGFFILPESHPKEKRTPIVLAKLNPFGAVGALRSAPGVGALVLVYCLATFAQLVLQATWVLFTTFRFNWGPGQNGVALFAVGVCAVIVQGGLLGRLVKRFGEAPLAIAGLASGTVAYTLYGLAPQGWMLYVIIYANFLSFAVAPALQGLVSKSFDASQQGYIMGSLSAISSMIMVVTPLIGTGLLGSVSHLPPHDWRVGISFFLCSALQGAALLIAWQRLRGAVSASPAPG